MTALVWLLAPQAHAADIYQVSITSCVKSSAKGEPSEVCER